MKNRSLEMVQLLLDRKAKLTATDKSGKRLYCTILNIYVCSVLYCFWIEGLIDLMTKEATVMYYIVLYCTVLYCNVLYCTVLYCNVLYCIASG